MTEVLNKLNKNLKKLNFNFVFLLEAFRNLLHQSSLNILYKRICTDCLYVKNKKSFIYSKRLRSHGITTLCALRSTCSIRTTCGISPPRLRFSSLLTPYSYWMTLSLIRPDILYPSFNFVLYSVFADS